MQTIGMQTIGADVDELLQEMGISGAGVPQRQIVGNPDVGRPRAFQMGFPASAVIATATSGSISQNADRDCFLDKLVMVGILAGAELAAAASFLTSLTVGGRNALIGAGGFTPLSAFRHDSLIFNKWGVVKSGNPVVLTVSNVTGGNATYYASFRASTID